MIVKIEYFLMESFQNPTVNYLYKVKDGIMQGFSNTTLPVKEMVAHGYKEVYRITNDVGKEVIIPKSDLVVSLIPNVEVENYKKNI